MKNLFRPAPLALTIATALTAGCANAPWSAEHSAPATKASVVTHYTDLAHALKVGAKVTVSISESRFVACNEAKAPTLHGNGTWRLELNKQL